MKEKNGITVILPIHEVNPEVEKYFGLAIASIINQIEIPDELLIVAKSDENLINFVNNFDYGVIKPFVRIIENTGDSSFQSQFNLGVSNTKTEWVSFIELDDEYSRIWFNNVLKYSKAYPEINVFLPIIVDVDPIGAFLGISNEPVWAAEFCDELGILDHQALINYQNFNFAGMVIRKSVIDEFFGIKPNIQLTFMYEFLLRMTHFDAKVMVIPKIGYKHTNQRPNSLFFNYKQSMQQDEAKWWLAQAKKEFYFTHDNRALVYKTEAEKA